MNDCIKFNAANKKSPYHHQGQARCSFGEVRG